jgi:hypothetical protein
VRSAAFTLVCALVLASAPAVLADEVDAAVAAARGGGLPIRAEVEQTAVSSAATQASAGRLAHASLGHLLSICEAAGEVVGAGPDVAAVFDGFRQSSSHWSIITGSRWTAMGTGSAVGPDGLLYVSVVFCDEIGSTTPTTAPAPAPAPKPAPAPAPGSSAPAASASRPDPQRAGVTVSLLLVGPGPFAPTDEWSAANVPLVV